ncbi:MULTISPECIES: hypothetical protein [unclassified Chryseobacterium]|uniref:hypothetical protein n=1 Tax=unclassified Chryseobacterium TaxID=2593645 RepID=UPI000F4F4B1A|nr:MULTISPECIES: hypothetical protein [unclassified Chryseobacterium]
MLDLFEKYGHKVVIKPNEGTGGNGALLASSIPELELHVHKTLKSRNTFCLCPYVEIQDEYRVIVLGGQTELIYKKAIPVITGDGKSTVLELLSGLYEEIPARIFTYLEEKGISLHDVPVDQAALKLNWKHNLGLGAGVWLDIDPILKKRIETLALAAAKEIGIQFASVDVVCDIQGNLSIIEINSGVMLVNFSMHGNQEYRIAKGIYTKAIHLMMEE